MPQTLTVADDAGEDLAVAGDGDDVGGVIRLDDVGVDEIEVIFLGGMIAGGLLDPAHAVPSDLRHLDLGTERANPTLQQTEPASISFLLVLEEELHAEADAQERPPIGDDFADDVDQPELVEPVHRGTGRADAGENDGVGLAHLSGCQT